MSAFFGRITQSFSSSSTKKILNEVLGSKYELQAKHQPLQIKKIIQGKLGKETFIKEMSTPNFIGKNSPSSMIATGDGQTNQSLFKILKKLSVFHHLVIYYNQYAQLVQQIDFGQLIIKNIENDWFMSKIIKPYICFIQKFCLSMEMYQKLKSMPCGPKQTIFQCMCYAVNILKSLFSVIGKLPSLGRYFRSNAPKTVDYFVQLMAYHAQIIYQGFRSCITQILVFSKNHLPQKQDQLIMKQILCEDLPWVNEEMKKLFLDKYFCPYEKGYGVKLYKLQEQNEYQTRIINGIISDHQKSKRKLQKSLMEESLFPKNMGKINHEDLERSFSFSISKLDYLKKSNIQTPNPQKQTNQSPHNKTLPNLGLGLRGLDKTSKNQFHPYVSSFDENIDEQIVEDV